MIRKIVIICFAVCLGCSAAIAQEIGSPAARKLAAKHKVFLTLTGAPGGMVGQTVYSAVAASLQKVNGYELVNSASDAEVILQLQCTGGFAQEGARFVHLTLLDPISRLPVWVIGEEAGGATYMRGVNAWDKNQSKVAAKLSDDLQHLASNLPA